MTLDTLVAQAQVAKRMIDSVITQMVMPRCGVIKNPDDVVAYDIANNFLIIRTPKIKCATCKVNKGIHKSPKGLLCEACTSS